MYNGMCTQSGLCGQHVLLHVKGVRDSGMRAAVKLVCELWANVIVWVQHVRIRFSDREVSYAATLLSLRTTV